MGKEDGVCPISASELVSSAIKRLLEAGAVSGLYRNRVLSASSVLSELLPEDYLPDIYLDLPLTDSGFRGISFALNGNDRCRLQHATGGAYFRRLQIPPLVGAEDAGTLCVVRLADADRQPECEIWKTGDEMPAWLADGLVLGERRQEDLLRQMQEAGCPESKLRILRKACGRVGLPFWDEKTGLGLWVVCIDLAGFESVGQAGFHAIIRISDRSRSVLGLAFKPSRTVQWHITDECDQRCRHCYLFAEDAGIACISTPYDELIRTLDSFTEYATSLHMYPMPVLSGGDPLLHPDFWRFAEELHRRGLHWRMMGNPFHLNADVCRRLKALGCYRYQMSLDGLEPYHDAMRKPGSFQSTLDAVGLLNAAGIKSQLMATVSRQNMDDVLACMDIAVQCRASSFLFARYCATSAGKAAEMYPTPEEYRSFLFKYYNKRRKYVEEGCGTSFPLKENLFKLLQWELGEFAIPPLPASKSYGRLDGCHLGRGCTVLSNGDLVACRRMESVLGNIKAESFSDIMSSDRRQAYADITSIQKCKDCELLQVCRGCRAVGFNATGDLQAADPCCWKA